MKHIKQNNQKSKSQSDLVSGRYNRYLLDNKNLANWSEVQVNNGIYAFFMDFLIINLKGIPLFNSNKLTIIQDDYGTRSYKNKCTVSFRGQKVATLVYNARPAFINKLLCQMQLENHLFYTLPLSDIKELVQTLMDELNLKFTGINRLDLALDMSNQNEFIKNVVHGLNAQQLRISGRQKKVVYYYETKNGVQELEGISVGNRTNGRFMRCYNKTKENSKNLKTYIRDAWGNLKINAYDVWRYEYQLKNAYLSTVKMSFDDLFDKEFLFNLFLEANKNHFQLKYNTGKKETNKEKDFKMFCPRMLSRILKVLKNPVTRIKRNIKESFIGQQRIIKGLMRSYFSSGQNSDYLAPLKAMIDDFHLWSWFARKRFHYIEEFYKQGIFKTVDIEKIYNDLGVEL